MADGQRILSYDVTVRMTINDDGSLDPLTENSTQAATTIVRHAGVAKTKRWRFRAQF